MSLLSILQLVGALLSAGKEAADLIDWWEKQRAAGQPYGAPLSLHQESQAKAIVAAKFDGDEDMAQNFITGTLGS
jgi:hypothetical protein